MGLKATFKIDHGDYNKSAAIDEHGDWGSLLAVRLNQEGERALKNGARAVRAEAQDVAELAQAYAPIDDADLEKAIKVYPPVGMPADLDENRRARAFVYVDSSAPANGAPGKTVGDYAYLMHEFLRPYGGSGAPNEKGYYDLGPKSVAKGGKVGGRFLLRAVKERMAGMTARIIKLVRER